MRVGSTILIWCCHTIILLIFLLPFFAYSKYFLSHAVKKCLSCTHIHTLRKNSLKTFPICIVQFYYRTKSDAHAMPKYVMPVSQLLYRFACIFPPLHQFFQSLSKQNKKCLMTAYPIFLIIPTY